MQQGHNLSGQGWTSYTSHSALLDSQINSLLIKENSILQFDAEKHKQAEWLQKRKDDVEKQIDQY